MYFERQRTRTKLSFMWLPTEKPQQQRAVFIAFRLPFDKMAFHPLSTVFLKYRSVALSRQHPQSVSLPIRNLLFHGNYALVRTMGQRK